MPPLAQTFRRTGRTGDQRTHAACAAERGQAILEAALALPVILVLAFGLVGAGRVVQAQTAVRAVAREAARTAAVAANSADEARVRGRLRGEEVAAGWGLHDESLTIAVEPDGRFVRGGVVIARVDYVVSLGDLPLLGWVRVPVTSTEVERIDRYRSLWP